MLVEDEEMTDLLAAAAGGLAKTVRRERLEQPGRWSQEALASRMRKLGHPTWRQTTVAKVEAGKRPVSLSEAIALSYALGLPTLDRLFGDGVDVGDRLLRNYTARQRQETEVLREQMTILLAQQDPKLAEAFRSSMAEVDAWAAQQTAEIKSDEQRYDAILDRLSTLDVSVRESGQD